MQHESWVKKYQPKTWEDCFLPDRTRADIESIVTASDMPNLLIYGPTGCGKTTLCEKIVEAFDGAPNRFSSSAEIEGSIRDKSNLEEMNGGFGRVFYLFDDAQRLSISAQSTLKIVLEESRGSRFLMATNSLRRLHKAFVSRLHLTDLQFESATERQALQARLVGLCERIGDENTGLPGSDEIKDIIERCSPNIRLTLLELEARTLCRIGSDANER